MRNVPPRNVIVTGASRGLGLGVAERLAADGFHVIAIARNESETLTKAIAVSGGRLHFLAADLSDVDCLGDLVRAAKKAFGPIYGLVNNAGGSTEGLLANLTHKQIEALIRLNTTSPIVLTKYVARGMMSGGRGADRQYLLDHGLHRVQRVIRLRRDQGVDGGLHQVPGS